MALSIIKPNVGSDNNVWGTELNQALDDIVTYVNGLGSGSGGLTQTDNGDGTITLHITAGSTITQTDNGDGTITIHA